MDIKKELENLIQEALKNLGIEAENISLEHPEAFENGDYSTNVAMVYKTDPEEIKKIIEKDLPKEISKIEIKNRFINFYLSREFFAESIKDILEKGENWGKNEILSGKKVMVEYTQPNPFKPFHIGHLMSNAIGESVSRIVEFSGAKTIRANYQGDIGPHVAKAIYQMLKNPFPTLPLSKGEGKGGGESISLIAEYIGRSYVVGNETYETDENAKKEIDEINKKIYDKSEPEINEIYDWGRKITLEAFEEIYKMLGTKFDYYFFESEVAPIGAKIVKENVPKVFEESDGAIVFHAEKYNPKLHTRVFINSQGLPTYETKEIGLTITKFGKESLGLSIITTATEQAEYMKVVACAVSILYPEYGEKMKHITHGMMRLASGKMSSRKGNVVTGESLLRDSLDVVYEKLKDREFSDAEKKEISEIVGVSALKYSILKSSLGNDIIFDFEKSISFEGDSGPYLQYTAVRANSILNKTKEFNLENKGDMPEEISNLEKMLYQFPEVVSRSYEELEPHHIATYLTELASAFNTFYGNTKILDTENKFAKYHLDLVKSFYQTMKNGLWLLGIKTPEKM